MLLLPLTAAANPYEDENAVPKDDMSRVLDISGQRLLSAKDILQPARQVMRVRIDWQEQGERYSLAQAVTEYSGTDGVLVRAGRTQLPGSFQAELLDEATGAVIGRDGIGTGQEFRRIVRSISFRLPVPERPATLRVLAEHPVSGVMESVLSETILPELIKPAAAVASPAGEVRMIRAASATPALQLVVYADGYKEQRRGQFFADAQRLADAASASDLPLKQHLEVRAVFAPSALELGSARDLGLPVAVRDSFLSLYFPYWHNFGRWYHVVYPTSEEVFRRGLATVPYDFPVILLDSADYFGVGNYNELTAIPARNSSFSYLFLHEFGHFLGLNEEYESGGPTELAFAPGIDEPWSPNITFHPEQDRLKWKDHVAAGTPLPTPAGSWRHGAWGAYRGGYAQTQPLGLSHKPGLSCTMGMTADFCAVCVAAMRRELELSTAGRRKE
jgi:hypothetical protein